MSDHISDLIYRALEQEAQANINKAQELLGYQPKYMISEGMDEAMDWYVNSLSI